jgi:hypothetical protein
MAKQLKIRSYSDLLAAIRARRDELDLPHMVIDDLAGLQEGYTSKVLSPTPRRFIGPISWNMLEALGLGLVLVNDTAALERSRRSHRWRTRKRKTPPGGWGGGWGRGTAA